MIKKSLITLALFALPLTSSAYTFSFFNFSSGDQSKLNLGAALPILTAPQGGTGVGSATAGQIGSCLTVASASPFTWSIGSCGGASASWATSSEQYFWSQFRDLSVQGNGYLAPTTTRGLIFLASSTIDKLTSTISTSTQATTTNLAISVLNQQIPYANAQGSILALIVGSGLSLSGGTLSAAAVAAGWATTSQDYYASQFNAWTVQGNGYLAPTTTRGIIVNNNSSSTIANLQVIYGTTTNATSTNLYVSGQTRIGAVSSALVLSGSTGILANYAGAAACTNQVVTAISAVGATTCTTVTNAMLTSSTISGVALGGTLAALTATNSTLTFSGSYDGSAARTIGINLANANTWSVLQTFSAGVLGNASSTLTLLTMVNSTSTQATSTNFNISGRSLTVNSSASTAYINGTTTISGGWASTTLDAMGKSFNIGTTTRLIRNNPEPMKVLGFYCVASTTGTILVRISHDNGNATETNTCTTGSYTIASTNNTFTTRENMNVQASSTAGIVNTFTISIDFQKTSD